MYCSKCGKQIADEAVICPGCGCATGNAPMPHTVSAGGAALLQTLSGKLKTNGIIWLVIGILQVLAGLFVEWWLLIVGVLNIISAVQDLSYSKTVLQNPAGIVEKFTPLTGPIITLVYNVIFGGLIGVVGSIYYLAAIRSFVLNNEQAFRQLDTTAVKG